MDRRRPRGRPCGLSFALLLLLVKMMSAPNGVLAQRGSKLHKASTCRIFGVFHVESGKGMNQFPFQEAEAACVSLGASLASVEALEKARSRGGFEVCRYGWVQGEEAYVPRVTKKFNCGRNAVGLLRKGFTAGGRFDAFCFDLNEKRKNSCRLETETTAITTATTAATAAARPSSSRAATPLPTRPQRTAGDQHSDSTTTAEPADSAQPPQPRTSPATSTPAPRPAHKASPCRIFGVFHVESGKGMNLFSFQEAEAACVSLGVSLASVEALEKARSRGEFEVCRYGWIQGKEAYMPRVTKLAACGTNAWGLQKKGFTAKGRFDAFCFDQNENKKNSCRLETETTSIATATTAATAAAGDQHSDSTTTAEPADSAQPPQPGTSPATSTPAPSQNSTDNSLANGATEILSTLMSGHSGDRGLPTRSGLQSQSATMPSVTRDPGSVSGDHEASGDASRDASSSTDVPANVELTVSTTQNLQSATYTGREYATAVLYFTDGATNTMSTLTQGHVGDRGLPTRSSLQSQSATMPSVTRDPGSESGDHEASGDAPPDNSRSTDEPDNVGSTVSSTQNLQSATYADQAYSTGTQTWNVFDTDAQADERHRLSTTHTETEVPQTPNRKLQLLIGAIILIVIISALCIWIWFRRKKRRSPPVESPIALSDLTMSNAGAIDGGEPEKREIDGHVVAVVAELVGGGGGANGQQDDAKKIFFCNPGDESHVNASEHIL